MKAFANTNPKDLTQAVALLGQAREQGRSAAIVGGGSDLLGMVKERLVQPDLLVNLKSIRGMDRVEPLGTGGAGRTAAPGGVKIGGLITLDALAHDPVIR